MSDPSVLDAATGGDTGAVVPAVRTFEWMTGFECTSFPQLGMDELALTQHDRFWGGDIVRAFEAGCRVIRYGIRWHVVNPRPRVYDWSSVDGPMELLRHLGMEPIVDLFHFGVPEWLTDSVMSTMFPDFQAELTREFVRRYPWVRWYTPTNEPYITAQFSGEHGHWFPFRHGTASFILAMRNVAKGLCDSWAEIVRERPDARMMVSDTCEYHHAMDEGLREHTDWLNERRFVMHELYGGRIGPDHRMWSWLRDNGLWERDLRWFQEHPAPLDVIGLDHYPHSEHQYRRDASGEIVDETRPLGQQLGPAELARQYFVRFGRPLVFAETGAPGDDGYRSWWLDRMVTECRSARQTGVPLIGMTWWGLIDQVDWASNLRRFDYHIDATGLYRLEWQGTDRLDRVPTATLDVWKRYTARPLAETVGELGAVTWDSSATTPLW